MFWPYVKSEIEHPLTSRKRDEAAPHFVLPVPVDAKPHVPDRLVSLECAEADGVLAEPEIQHVLCKIKLLDNWIIALYLSDLDELFNLGRHKRLVSDRLDHQLVVKYPSSCTGPRHNAIKAINKPAE